MKALNLVILTMLSVTWPLSGMAAEMSLAAKLVNQLKANHFEGLDKADYSLIDMRGVSLPGQLKKDYEQLRCKRVTGDSQVMLVNLDAAQFLEFSNTENGCGISIVRYYDLAGNPLVFCQGSNSNDWKCSRR